MGLLRQGLLRKAAACPVETIGVATGEIQRARPPGECAGLFAEFGQCQV